jgi:hypothetical protein
MFGRAEIFWNAIAVDQRGIGNDLVVQTERHESASTSYIHTHHSRFIPEGVAEVSQIFLRDTHVLPKLVSYEEHYRRW